MSLFGLVLMGVASHYSDGVMESVLWNRQYGSAWVPMSVELPAHMGMIAVRDCECLGEVWWLRPEGWDGFEPYLVVDCARPQGTDGAWEWMTNNNVMVEVGYKTAQRWGSVEQGIPVERLITQPEGM